MVSGGVPNSTSWRYSRFINDDDCDYKLTITRDGYETIHVQCTFSRVRRLPKNRGYVTRSDCGRIAGPARTFDGEEEFRIVDGVLRHRRLHWKCVDGC